jgi:predicted DNA-binding protein YlxM (UPF0122 family)
MEPMDNPLEEKIRSNSLYDLYGKLLTEKQREYFEYYYQNDYSLSEIAALLKVSRNAVYDQIKIVVGHLENYEEKLGLLKQKQTLADLAKKIKALYPDDAKLAKLVDKIEKTE